MAESLPRYGVELRGPISLAFPYVVAPGEIQKLWLDENKALGLAKSVGGLRYVVARLLRRSRILVECETSTGTRYCTSGEKVLDWDEQVPWKRG